MNRLFLLDAYALIFRAYYALIKMPRITQTGFNTSAIFGFVNTLEEILRKENPSHIAVCFDPPGPTFRNEAFAEYKAERAATPEDIRLSIPFIKEIVKAYNIRVVEVEGFEADDVIGTLAKEAERDGFTTFMMTPDKDYGQLVSPSILQYKPAYRGQEFEIRGEEEICGRYGLERTEQVIDLLALMGDKVDNIPGCPGVGEKTAIKLIQEFGSVEKLIENTGSLKGALKRKIEENAEQIRFSKYLATIRTDVPVGITPEELKRGAEDIDKLMAIFKELEFRTLAERVKRRILSMQNAECTMHNGATQFAEAGDSRPFFGSAEAGSSRHNGSALAEAGGSRPLFGTAEAGSSRHNGSALGGAGGSGQQPSLFDFEEEDADSSQSSQSPQSSQSSQSSHSYQSFDSADYSIISSGEELNGLSEELMELSEGAQCGVFLLADGENDATASWVGTAIALKPGKARYIPTFFKEGVDFILDLLARKDIEKISGNTKRDYVIAARRRNDKVPAVENFYDVALAHYMLQPEMRHGLDELAMQYLGHTPATLGSNPQGVGTRKLEAPATGRTTGAKRGVKSFVAANIEISALAPWACEQADIALRLKAPLEKALKQESEEMRNLLYQIEFPLVRVLAEMEITGVRIDVTALNEAAKTMESRIAALEKEIHEMAGEEFNVSSPAKVGEILFDKLQLDPKAKKTKTGQYSTSEDILEKLTAKHPIVEKIMKYRALKKLLTTYLTALPANINPETGKVHTNYNQTVTATGRISSSSPNLQNIPIRDDEGREIRKAFIPDAGNIFLSADYSQIELRLVADFADDETMLDAFRNKKDIHAITAAKIYHKEPEEVSDNERRHAKTANFGILYGISAFGLASRLAIPRGEAKELIDNYFATFPTIRKYMSDSVEKAREHGYVETRMGRKRMLPDINSRNPVVRGYAERNAVNAPVQGSAADIIKKAMVDIDREMRERGMRSKMIMQVHDELNFDVVPEEMPAMQEMVSRLMEGAYQGRVPLTASCGVGANWLEAH